MTEANPTAVLKTPFHPASHYRCPSDVLRDTKLSAAEKRLILSSWASDMYAVESNPSLREVPGVPHRIRLDDILSVLRQLDDGFDPPPCGGAAMRGLATRFARCSRPRRGSGEGSQREATIVGCGTMSMPISAFGFHDCKCTFRCLRRANCDYDHFGPWEAVVGSSRAGATPRAQ